MVKLVACRAPEDTALRSLTGPKERQCMSLLSPKDSCSPWATLFPGMKEVPSEDTAGQIDKQSQEISLKMNEWMNNYN